jgi:hypothetical protein
MTCCTFHCASCGSHFHSLEAFDLHRAGEHATQRVCLDPDDFDTLVVATTGGVCRLVQGVDQISGVPIFRSKRHAEDHDAVLRLRSADRRHGSAGDGVEAPQDSEASARAVAEVRP